MDTFPGVPTVQEYIAVCICGIPVPTEEKD
jgi:hypothetical protein